MRDEMAASKSRHELTFTEDADVFMFDVDVNNNAVDGASEDEDNWEDIVHSCVYTFLTISFIRFLLFSQGKLLESIIVHVEIEYSEQTQSGHFSSWHCCVHI